jgi:type 1 glutamine amidotransferase
MIRLYKNDKKYFSFRAKGKFVGYEKKTNGNRIMTYAVFENVESVNKKPLYDSLFTLRSKQFYFHVAPNNSAYLIYKPIKGLRQEAARRIINSKHINMNVPIFTIGSMTNISDDMPSHTISSISKGNWEDYASDIIYYNDRNLTSVGNDLSKKIGEYFGGKTRKSRRTKKSKSRKH